MSEPVNSDWLASAVNLCLYICAHDGLLSEKEEYEIAQLFSKHFALDIEVFSSIAEEFFSSSELVENVVSDLSGTERVPIVLEIAHIAAASDGLDIRENLALQKVKILLESKNG